MKIISFAKTTPAVIARRKTRTRRFWNSNYASLFHAGDLCQAWDHVPRVKGAKRVETIRLTADPKWEERGTPIGLMDHDAEGFTYLRSLTLDQRLPDELEVLWASWSRDGSPGCWVVNFEYVDEALREAGA